MQRATAWLAFCSLCVALAGCSSKHDAAEGAIAPPDDAVPVVVETAQLRTMTETVSGLGRCEALPEQIASLTPAIEGQVEKIIPKLGQAVRQGDPIIQLDTRIAAANLAEKTAARDGLKDSLALLESPPRPEELKSQELAVDLAKSALDKARSNTDRLRPLQGKEISSAQMFEAENAQKQAELQLRAAEAQLAALKLKPRAEAIREAESKIKTADALVDSADAQLKSHTLRSPIDGVFDSVNCRLGQTVTVGTAIGEVVDARQLHVLVWLPARNAARVKVGQKAKVRWGNLSRRDADPTATAPVESEELTGEVSLVGLVADPQTGNLPVRVQIENADSKLHVGQSAVASIIVKEKADALAIPVNALFDVGQGPVFNIVREGKSVRAYPELGLREPGWVEVGGDQLSDLKAGESVIVDGGYNLPEGNPVKSATASAENPR